MGRVEFQRDGVRRNVSRAGTCQKRSSRYFPRNTGSRFSRNARGPSLASSDAITAIPCCYSITNASASGSVSVERKVATMAFTASGPFFAMRAAISLAFASACPSGTTWLISPSS